MQLNEPRLCTCNNDTLHYHSSLTHTNNHKRTQRLAREPLRAKCCGGSTGAPRSPSGFVRAAGCSRRSVGVALAGESVSWSLTRVWFVNWYYWCSLIRRQSAFKVSNFFRLGAIHHAFDFSAHQAIYNFLHLLVSLYFLLSNSCIFWERYQKKSPHTVRALVWRETQRSHRFRLFCLLRSHRLIDIFISVSSNGAYPLLAGKVFHGQ